MLELYFTRDEQPSNNEQIGAAGEIDYEEFDEAQKLEVIESDLDYFDNFRWTSQQVQQKRAMLTPAIGAAIPTLAAILKQAFGTGCALVAFGD